LRSILSVTTAATVTALTTLERLKQELDITVSTYDSLLRAKIKEATSDINARAWADPRETLTQTFWNVQGEEYLILRRRPVVSITSVTLDDVALETTEYRLDDETGVLYCLDTSGYPISWEACKSIIVVYVAGYIMPGQTSANLEPALEGAAIELLQSYWQSRGRDPLIKSESVPDLGEVSYWVGAVGEAGSLPPGVETKIAPFRRVML